MDKVFRPGNSFSSYRNTMAPVTPTAPIVEEWPTCLLTSIKFWWRPPISGAPLTHYTLACAAISYSQDLSGDVTSHTVTGLTSSTEYAFTITATNVSGTGPATAFPLVSAGLPPVGPSQATLTKVNATTARVDWIPSTIANQAKTNWYVVTGLPSTFGVSSFYKTQYPHISTLTIPELSTNVAYRFLVQAVSDPGYSQPLAYTSTILFGDIVTAGLLLNLDAGNVASYSGSGSTWTDLTGNARNATLINTPTYSSSNSGYLNFAPASLEYATIPNIGDRPTWTVETWVRFTGSLNGRVASVVTNQFNLVNKLNFSIGTNNAPSNYNICVGFFDALGSAWHNTAGFAPTLNTWYHIVGTYDGTTIKQYVNGVLNSSTSYAGTPSSGGEIRICRRWDETLTSNNLMPADVGVVRVYGGALTGGEVTGNFEALRGRYGV